MGASVCAALRQLAYARRLPYHEARRCHVVQVAVQPRQVHFAPATHCKDEREEREGGERGRERERGKRGREERERGKRETRRGEREREREREVR